MMYQVALIKGVINQYILFCKINDNIVVQQLNSKKFLRSISKNKKVRASTRFNYLNRNRK